MNIAQAQKTRVTPEGIIVDMDNIVQGYKCLHCSTAHVLDDDVIDDEEITSIIYMWMNSHVDCAQLYV